MLWPVSCLFLKEVVKTEFTYEGRVILLIAILVSFGPNLLIAFGAMCQSFSDFESPKEPFLSKLFCIKN